MDYLREVSPSLELLPITLRPGYAKGEGTVLADDLATVKSIKHVIGTVLRGVGDATASPLVAITNQEAKDASSLVNRTDCRRCAQGIL